jgi:hypothetical protein
MMMMKGLMTPMTLEEEYAIVTPEENKSNTEHAMKYYMLGPEKDPSDEPDNNQPYWVEIAAVWKLDESEARRQRCANCEYFDNTPEKLLEMDTIPRNDFDTGAGGRGYCNKLELICHNLRACTAWECKEYIKGD